MRIILLLILLQTAFQGKVLLPKKIIYSVDCGSPVDKHTSIGIKFQKDQNYDKKVHTNDADYRSNQEVHSSIIKYTSDPDIYLTERHGYQSFKYTVPIQREGIYVLILKFAEMYFREPGQRVFNIKFGDKIVVNSLDIFSKVGRLAAYDEYIEFERKGDLIFFRNQLCTNAFNDQSKMLVVEFEKTQKDNPFVHGIMLFQGSLDETDYSEQNSMRQNWEKNYYEEQKKREDEQVKRNEARLKKKERVKIRNDWYDSDDQFEDVNKFIPIDQQIQEEKKTQREVPPLRELLMTPLGIVMMIGFFVSSFVLIAFTFFDPYGQKSREAQQKLAKQKQIENKNSQVQQATKISKNE